MSLLSPSRNYKNTTVKAYDAIAKVYHSQNFRRSFWELQFNELLTLIKQDKRSFKDMSLLDLGCGTGRDARMVATSGMHYVGVDLSEGMLGVARENNPNEKFIKMDVTDLDFGEGEFDVVWASAVLLHLDEDDLAKTMKEIRSVLKNDGYLYVAMEQQKSGQERKEMKKSRKGGEEIERFFVRYKEGEFEKVLARFGFGVVRQGTQDEGDAGDKSWLWYLARVG